MSITQDKQLTAIAVGDLMISSEKVAHVQVNNPLEHALLVLIKSGYSAVPVLDTSYKLVGTIGKTIILNEILGLEHIEVDKLSDMRVEEVMNDDIPSILKEETFMKGLDATINHPFVCVADKEGYFDGILTRRAILKQLKRDIYTTKS
ncbi:putative transcriptional regulator [Virgibacillus natechei]|uniref:Transcriptional regulator n=1 Tax=Virgibacillus natechei TaxID=1216297 RepID=A0ABS4ICV0_9BACI|nr:cyclic-di-AMP-binding protein CbpB [Virgibacillus natechei]MBP1968261.1 putative transcriptional regulator [Virgibacillus natechei]UZD14472.1 CBS domain-containing protein [Virgibacillus natechei]